jgi:hypothetical protein
VLHPLDSHALDGSRLGRDAKTLALFARYEGIGA